MVQIKILLITLLISFQAQAQMAKRIVSLVPSVTKEIYLLGRQNRLVGCTNFCKPDPKDQVSVVASAVSVNIEKTLSLKPDLIIASSLTNPETLDAFRKAGIRVEYFPYPKSFDEVCGYLLKLGQLTDAAVEAQTMVDDAKKRIAEVRKKVPAGKHPKMFLQIGANPLFCAIPNTFMDDFIRFSGGTNIASDLKNGAISRENVLVRNPDVILIVTMGLAGNEEKETWQKYPMLNAARLRKIFILDSEKTSSATPFDFVESLEEIIRLTYQ